MGRVVTKKSGPFTIDPNARKNLQALREALLLVQHHDEPAKFVRYHALRTGLQKQLAYYECERSSEASRQKPSRKTLVLLDECIRSVTELSSTLSNRLAKMTPPRGEIPSPRAVLPFLLAEDLLETVDNILHGRGGSLDSAIGLGKTEAKVKKSTQDIALLRSALKLRNTGKTFPQIASALGRDLRFVQRLWSNHDLFFAAIDKGELDG